MAKADGRTGPRAAALSILLGLVLALAAAPAQAVTIRELPTELTATGSPNHITAGPDGNLWVTGHNLASIDEFSPAGEVHEYFLTPNSSPEGITVGPGGTLWFSEQGFDTVGRIGTAGALTEFAASGITGQTAGIAAGPEGNLWVTQNDGKVGRITPGGFVTEYSAGITGSNLYGIALGPDGNLWFTERAGDRIGRITPRGVVTEFSSGITPGSEPRAITAGPDGNLWFTERAGDRIGRITPQGVVTEFSSGISPGSEPQEITAGPDGNVWFTERAGNRIARITPAGVVTEFSEGITPGGEPSGITAGPEDSVWFTEEAGQIGQVLLGPAGTPAPHPPPTVFTRGASSVTQTSASFRATVNPRGTTVNDCHFEYGTTLSYGSSVPCASLPGSGSIPVVVAASLAGLGENTTYHLRVVASSEGGTSYGTDQTFTTEPPPPVSTSGMWVGVDAGGWGPEQYADVKGAVDYVRLDGSNRQTADISGWTDAGVRVIDDISGPYNSGGVQAINITEWVNRAVAWVKANPEAAAVEVLNEPGGEWFWGPGAESTANAAAYASLLKAVHEAFVANFGSARPLILASYDGGQDDNVSWGEKVWNENTNGGIKVNDYVDGVTVHPYGGVGARAGSALGHRASVEAAHAQTGKRVYVTELGFPTAVAQPATGDSLQWTEAEQAANIYNFIAWARSTGYVAAVMVFNYRDYGSNAFYGIERWENPAGPNGSRKPAYTALQEAARGLPLSLP